MRYTLRPPGRTRPSDGRSGPCRPARVVRKAARGHRRSIHLDGRDLPKKRRSPHDRISRVFRTQSPPHKTNGSKRRLRTNRCDSHGFQRALQSGGLPAWLIDSNLAGGGPLMDLGIYWVNTTRGLLGEDPVRASAQAWSRDASRFRQVEEGNFGSSIRAGLFNKEPRRTVRHCRPSSLFTVRTGGFC
jgi:hypothetical protein